MRRTPDFLEAGRGAAHFREIQQLDSAAQVAESRYQLATAKLQLVKQKLSENKQALDVARLNLAAAQKALAQRLVAIYTSQESQSSLAVILGAKSLDDLVNRIETRQHRHEPEFDAHQAVRGVRALDRPPPEPLHTRKALGRPPRSRARRR